MFRLLQVPPGCWTLAAHPRPRGDYISRSTLRQRERLRTRAAQPAGLGGQGCLGGRGRGAGRPPPGAAVRRGAVTRRRALRSAGIRSVEFWVWVSSLDTGVPGPSVVALHKSSSGRRTPVELTLLMVTCPLHAWFSELRGLGYHSRCLRPWRCSVLQSRPLGSVWDVRWGRVSSCPFAPGASRGRAPHLPLPAQSSPPSARATGCLSWAFRIVSFASSLYCCRNGSTL